MKLKHYLNFQGMSKLSSTLPLYILFARYQQQKGKSSSIDLMACVVQLINSKIFCKGTKFTSSCLHILEETWYVFIEECYIFIHTHTQIQTSTDNKYRFSSAMSTSMTQNTPISQTQSIPFLVKNNRSVQFFKYLESLGIYWKKSLGIYCPFVIIFNFSRSFS